MSNDNVVEYQDVVAYNVQALLEEVVSLVYEGWQISPTNPGESIGMFGMTLTCTMMRHKDDKPKLSRAEILAAAREAKKAKGSNATLDTETIVA